MMSHGIPFSALALAGLVLSGCSLTSVAPPQATESADRATAEYFQQTSSNTVRIVVVHDALFVPTPVRTTLYVDGRALGTFNQGEQMTFFVPPGILRLGWSALSAGNFREQEFKVSATSKNTFRFGTPGRAAVMRFAREGEEAN